MLIRESSASFAERRASGRAGFSLLELVITITVLAILGAIAVSLLADDPGAARNAKLQSDITILNQMVAIYSSDGGNLASMPDADSVLEKMKRVRPQAEWQSHVGIASGRLVDVRLRARITTEPDADNNPRAIWNRKTQRFELSYAPGSAVSEFYLDESLARANLDTDRTRYEAPRRL